jgi:RyR domain
MIMTTMVTMALLVAACAQAAHETNRAYCLALGDTSQPPWESAPDWQRSSAENGVRGVLVDGNGPRASHESWLKEKADTGWKYGPVKDPEKKEHPCFVPYDELPEAQRAKDDLFIATVKSIAAALGQSPALIGLREASSGT